VLFPEPGQHAIPVVANLFADRSWIADAVGVPVDRLLPAFQDAVRHPLPWVEVIKTAPAQEVVHEKVDLLKQLPIPKHNELDSGPYITAALLIARNPKTGIQNVLDSPLPGERAGSYRRLIAAPAHPCITSGWPRRPAMVSRSHL